MLRNPTRPDWSESPPAAFWLGRAGGCIGRARMGTDGDPPDSESSSESEQRRMADGVVVRDPFDVFCVRPLPSCVRNPTFPSISAHLKQTKTTKKNTIFGYKWKIPLSRILKTFSRILNPIWYESSASLSIMHVLTWCNWRDKEHDKKKIIIQNLKKE